MLDQICDEFAGRVAPVQWHANSFYPYLYNEEAWDKWHLYPPPMNGLYYYPWLWADGKSSYYDFSKWRDSVVRHLSVPSEVMLTDIGTVYDPQARAGEVRFECFNSSPSPIVAAVQVVITEDSINYPTPNGDTWHNHVCRDYVPTINGTPVEVPAGGYDSVAVSFAVDTTWVAERCNVLVWLQDMTVQQDSTMPVFQGSISRLLDFVGVQEPRPVGRAAFTVSAVPNPCRTSCEFSLSGSREGAVTIYAPDGRLVSRLTTKGGRALWRRPSEVARGVYLYRVRAGAATSEGKLVVTD